MWRFGGRGREKNFLGPCCKIVVGWPKLAGKLQTWEFPPKSDGRVSKKNIMDWDKDSLVSKRQSSTCKQSKTKHSFTASHQQANVQPFLEGRASLHAMIIWEDKCQTSHFLCLSLRFHSWACQHRVGRALWLAWVSCPGFASSKLLAHCQPTGEGSVGKRKGFDTGKTLFSSS